jgi:hypothetical protein
MDLGDPWALFSGVAIGAVGFMLFMHGKKQTNLKCLATGGVLCIYPYFITSVLLMWAIAAACLGALYAATRGD